MTPALPPAPRRRPLRLATVAVLFTFGCTTVRAPVTVIPEAIPVRDGRAEPQLALWVEGGDAPTAAEQQAAAQQAQAALAQAAQGLEAPDGEGLLVVRAQGVTRTKGRRNDQVAGGVALGVALVAVIVVVVAVLVAEGKGGGRAAKPAARAAPAPRGGGAPVARPVPVPAGAVRPVRVPRVRPAPPPGYAPLVPHDGVVIYGQPHVSWAWWVDLTPPPPPPAATTQLVDGVPQPVGSYVLAPAAAGEPDPGLDGAAFEGEPLEEAPPPGLTEVRLSPPAPLPLDGRGFFAGDDLEVELLVVDRVTGEPRARKIARDDVSPTDAAAVRKLLRAAVADPEGWETLAPAAPPAPAP